MNYEALCEKVISVVHKAGNFIRKEALLFDSSKIEYKGLNDLVSYVDKQAERLLVEGLQPLLANAGFLTEENTLDFTASDHVWIIDPLDGTTNFIHGIPAYAISIALYEKGVPVLGVVYELNRDEIFYAWKNGGAFLNNRRIFVSKNATLSASLLATGFPYYQFDQLPEYISLLQQLMKECHGIRRIGSAALDLAYTACGRFDAFFEYNLNAWDVAGGAFIVEQAGGQILNFSGGPEFIESTQILATNSLLTNEILEIIRTTFK